MMLPVDFRATVEAVREAENDHSGIKRQAGSADGIAVSIDNVVSVRIESAFERQRKIKASVFQQSEPATEIEIVSAPRFGLEVAHP